MFKEYCIDFADEGCLLWKVAQTFLEIFKQPLAVNTKLYERESELGTFFFKRESHLHFKLLYTITLIVVYSV
jgi:hypothetical protein